MESLQELADRAIEKRLEFERCLLEAINIVLAEDIMLEYGRGQNAKDKY